MAKLNGSLTITRQSSDMIVVRIRDESSRTAFVDIELSPHDFCLAVTGQGEIRGKMRVFGLDRVGKIKVTEPRQIISGIDSYDRKAHELWLDQNAQEDGWILDKYLGLQSSMTQTIAGTLLKYSVTKYVDANAETR